MFIKHSRFSRLQACCPYQLIPNTVYLYFSLGNVPFPVFIYDFYGLFQVFL